MDHVPLTDETEVVDGVHLAVLAAGEQMNVQHFRIEPGATVPTHDHPHEQAGFVYEGELVFVLDGGAHRISTAESYVIPGGESHAAENQGEATVCGVDIFTPPRVNPDWAE